MYKSRAFPRSLLRRALCPPPLSLGIVWGGWGSPCSMSGGGKAWLLARLVSPGSRDPASALATAWSFSSTFLDLCPCLCPCLTSDSHVWGHLGNFESRTEMDSPRRALSPCLLCCRRLTACYGFLQWLFYTFCCYSARLNCFHVVFWVLLWGTGGVLHSSFSSYFPWHGAYVFDKFMFVSPGFFLLQSLVYLFSTISSSSFDVHFQQFSAFCSETLRITAS